ncbi:MAG: helix-turn-helix domain-containing protein [Euryarchaeota archaeon]|nr:helix-turn-helix domain-containing protein [Euryarchaeota archaeon]
MAETGSIYDRTDREGVSTAEYDQLLAATTTYRERLLVRLGGEVGLRATEMTTIRLNDIVRVRSDPDRFVLSVSEQDGSREAYLPRSIEEELRRYATSNAVGDDERIFGVTPRRVQMLVRKVGDRAADRTGAERFETVSAQDLRGYFARTLLRGREISPRIVRSIGGWASVEALNPYLDAPTTEEIVAALEEPSKTHRSAALDSALVDASTREELESVVCESLAEQYRFAWIEAPELGETRAPNAASGIDHESIRSLRDGFGGSDRTRVDRANIVESAIRYGETRYGTLYVGIRGPVRTETREHLSVVGRRIGHAITAIRRQKLLLADTILELEFYTADSQSVFVAASEQFDCRFDLESIVSASESALLYYVTLSGASAPDVLEFAGERPGVADSRLVEGRDSGALVEFVVSGSCPLLLLTDYGATVREMTVENGGARILADCAYDTDLRALVDRVTGAFPDTRFVGKQATERGANTPDGFKRGATDRLTERQRAALQAAYFGGYFDWPRGSTAEEIADAMGVSSPTLHSHLRKGQRELLELLFEEE